MNGPVHLPTGNLETQHEWHEAYRDHMANMYRTSYQDMTTGKEVAVKNDFPDGYGGHVPSLRHDILFRNTGFDRRQEELRNDYNRDVFPSFAEQNDGVPCSTVRPRGKVKVPTVGTIPDIRMKPQWAIKVNSAIDPPSLRMTPPGTARMQTAYRAQSSPGGRANNAAMSTGQSVTTSRPRSNSSAREQPPQNMTKSLRMMAAANDSQMPNTADTLRRWAVPSNSFRNGRGGGGGGNLETTLQSSPLTAR